MAAKASRRSATRRLINAVAAAEFGGDRRLDLGRADEDADAAFAEESQRLIAIVAEAQVPSGNDGLVTRRGAFNVD